MAEYEESNYHNQFVPPEVVFEILKRLPAKSLCRFKCVSILWHAIVSDRVFVSSYWLHRSSSPGLLVTLLQRGDFAGQAPKSKDVWLHLHAQSHHGDGSDLERAPDHFKVHAEAGRYRKPMHVSQSVGGLVCLERQDRIKICNPSTGQDVSIRAAVQHSRDYDIEWTSLCFDPVINQHKVLQSITDLRLHVLEHHVMTFSAAGLIGDRSWRRIREVPLYSARCMDQDEVCLNGVLYYMVRLFLQDERGQRFLMLFHVHEERFQLSSVNLDMPRIDPHNYQRKLVEYSNGRVAIVDCPSFKLTGSISCIKLRVLDRSGATCHMQNIALPPEEMLPRDGRLSVLGSIHAGKVLVFILIVGWDSSCLFYDAKIDSFTKRVHIHMPPIGGYPLGWPIDRRLSVSDHEENLMALEN